MEQGHILVRLYCPICCGRGASEQHVVCSVCFGSGHLNEPNSPNPFRQLCKAGFLMHFLREAMEASAAHFGNIQLYDRSHHALRIAAQQGFGKEFLRFFDVVSGNDCACGSAMAQLSRVVVADVSSDPIFGDATSRDVMLRAQARAVQSTPLISSSGQFFGIISTHYRQPRSFARRELNALDKLGRQFAGRIEEHLHFPLSLR